MAAELLSNGQQHKSVPKSYIWPESDRPRLTEVCSDDNIPVIDMSCPDKSRLASHIADAFGSYGFFQAVNHGISDELIRKVMAVSAELYHLPMEDKLSLYSDDPLKKVRLSTSTNVRKETRHSWRDYLRLHCYPLEEFMPEWPSKPAAFKEVVSTYCKEVRELGFRLLGLISLSLDLEEDYIRNALGDQEQHMSINFYPPCPDPELTYGLQAHTDQNALTILLQDPHVAGLQVRRDGKWIAVDPLPGALIVNIGDQLQALSNGRYKSDWHRAVVNSDKVRISVGSFLAPNYSTIVSPAKRLISKETPAMYRSYTYDEYFKKFWSRELDDKQCLEFFMI